MWYINLKETNKQEKQIKIQRHIQHYGGYQREERIVKGKCGPICGDRRQFDFRQ